MLYKSRLDEEKLNQSGLNDRQIKAILFTKNNGKITNKEYCELNSVSKATATRDLKELIDKKIFKQHGTKGHGSFYQLIGSIGS